MRKFTQSELIIASHNAGKVKEIAALLSPYGLQVQSSSDLGVVEPEETEPTFIGNAKLKALHTMHATGKPSLADDSGLAVTALNGDPGIYSARWAETADGSRDFQLGMDRVNTSLGDSPDRSAQFICVLALAWPDEHVEVFEGTVGGSLVWPPRGTRGFGYDPIFVPTGRQLSFGEMDPAEKHAMSHRADAFNKLVRDCFD